ncbi:MAG: hypothetical protein VX253_12080, partial [Bacteroidota bacterium]|nr:hypothetical protein [Bacteroidota bacterium]
MKKEKLIFGTLGLLGLLFTACDSNDDGTSPENPEAGVESKYIITATPTAAGSEGVADYIL